MCTVCEKLLMIYIYTNDVYIYITAVMKGFKKTQLMQCLENYKALSVWQVDTLALCCSLLQ